MLDELRRAFLGNVCWDLWPTFFVFASTLRNGERSATVPALASVDAEPDILAVEAEFLVESTLLGETSMFGMEVCGVTD
jgi:hypothetical protein